jgi:asparagine synthetase B (glutamine-hydrolysing)
MCGLTTFLAQNGHSGSKANGHVQTYNTEAALEASIEIVKHRGPDARGHWISDDSKVGKCRLSYVMEGDAQFYLINCLDQSSNHFTYRFGPCSPLNY